MMKNERNFNTEVKSTLCDRLIREEERKENVRSTTGDFDASVWKISARMMLAVT